MGGGIGRGVHVLNILKAVSQVAQERVIQVFQHSPLSNNVSDTLRPDDCRTTIN